MTNAPTKSARPPKASMNFRTSAMSSFVPFACVATSALPVATSAPAGRIGPIARTSRSGETPFLRRHEDLVEAAGLAEEVLRRRGVEDRERQPAERVERRELRDAGDREAADGPAPGDADRVADREAVLVAVSGSIATSCEPAGQRPSVSTERVEPRLGPRRC